MDGIINVWTDGGCRSNPGPGAWGVVIEGPSFKQALSGFIEQTTNNEAEYRAMIGALTWLIKSRPKRNPVVIHSDSQLMIEQLRLRYAVRTPSIQPWFDSAFSLLLELRQLTDVELVLIRRELNKEADQLCNIEQDAHGVVCVRRKRPVVPAHNQEFLVPSDAESI